MSKRAGYLSAASQAKMRARHCEQNGDWWNAQIWWAKYHHWLELAKKEEKDETDP